MRALVAGDVDATKLKEAVNEVGANDRRNGDTGIDADRQSGRAAMTALPPDPDPAESPVIADAHGVEPGETPPDSGSMSASANQNPPPVRRFTPITVAAMIAVGVLFAIFLTVAVIYMLQVGGVMDRS